MPYRIRERRVARRAISRLPEEAAAVERAAQPAGLSPAQGALLQLQREQGNQQVARMLAVQRDTAGDLNDMADLGGAKAVADQQREREQNTRPPIQQVSNVNDVKSAQVMVERLESWRAPMQEGAGASGAFVVSPNRVTPDKMAANEQAIALLNDYLVTAGEQGRTLGSFQGSLQMARVDYERLNAQVTHLTVTNSIARGSSAAEMGRQVTKGAGFADPDAARQRMQKLDSDPRSNVGVLHNQVQDAHDSMVTLSQQVGARQAASSSAAYAFDSTLNDFKTGIPTVTTNPDQAKELGEIKEKIETVKKWVGKGLDLAGKAAEAAGVEGADKAVEPAKKAAEFLTDQFFEPQLNDINTKISQYNTAHSEHAITAKLDAVRAASRTFTQSIVDFNNVREQFEHAQNVFRDKLKQFGRSAQAAHGDKFSQIASVLAEVDAYETRLDEALRLGFQEQAAAKEAAGSRQTLRGGANPASTAPYYEPYKFFHNNGGWNYECQKHDIDLTTILASHTSGSAEMAVTGVNARVDEAVKTLQQYRQEVDPMRSALAQAMDLRMDNAMPSTPGGGPAPTSRSEKQGL